MEAKSYMFYCYNKELLVFINSEGLASEITMFLYKNYVNSKSYVIKFCK